MRQENQNRRRLKQAGFPYTKTLDELDLGRYNGSIIVTTNLAFSEWTSLFENTALVAALVDRLTFNSYILDMNGDSYRLDHTKRNS